MKGLNARLCRSGMIACLALTVAACATTTEPVSAPARTVAREPAADDRARELARLVNRHRAARGRRALIWDERLAAIAARHSRDMARRDYFDHRGPDGRDPFDRLRVAGIRYQAAAENIAFGDSAPEDVLEGWVDSPGHRRNLENAAFTLQGIGVFEDHWTQVMVRER